MQKEVLDRISIIVPSLNPDEKLQKTVTSLLDVGFTDIICVNDGSSEDNLKFFPKANDNIVILTHEVNKGKGAALKTAFSYLKEHRPNSLGAVTVDGDGQHAANDVLNCAVKMIELGDNIILGCRDFSEENVPPRSRFGNKITSGVFKVFCGMKISDTQTGLRAFPACFYDDMLEIKGERFEYETNMLLEMKAREIKYSEVKIETVYIEENKTSHFRPVRDSFRIYSLILKFSLGQFAEFFVCSIASFIIDASLLLLLLTLFETVLKVDFKHQGFDKVFYTDISMIIARTCSSAFNFAVNRMFVFKSNSALGKDLAKYYSVAIPILFVSMAISSLLEQIAIFNSSFMITVLVCVVNCFLYLASYFLQKKWVFKKKK